MPTDHRQITLTTAVSSDSPDPVTRNMKIPGFLSKAAQALYEAHINTLAVVQSPRQVNMQFIVDRNDFQRAQKVLHKAFVEDQE